MRPGAREDCGDRIDNDSDGRLDSDDFDCLLEPACGGCIPSPEICFDGIDNDCDGRPDCADPDCAGDPSCCVPTGPEACFNFITDCTPFPAVGECCNGIVDNGNGIVDEVTCRCITDGDCASGGPIPLVCWSATIQVCAPHCAFIGGDMFCRMIDPSLRCSMLTGECLF